MSSIQERIDDLKKRGASLLDSNRLDEAKALFTDVVKRWPDDAESWLQLSTVNGRLGRFDEAGECSQRAIALQPDFCDAHVNLGSVLQRKGRHEEALAEYHKALQIDPEHLDAHFKIGLVYTALGRYDDAVEAYRAGFRLCPSHKFGIAMRQQALSLMQSDHLVEARMLLDLAGEVFPDDVDVWYALSTINGQLGNIREASDCCRRVLSIQPGHLGALANLGITFVQQGRFDEAVNVFLKALQINPQSMAVLNSLAKICFTQEHFKKYLQVYHHVVAGMPDPIEARAEFMKTIENNIPLEYEPWLDDELKKCFSIKDIDYTPISLVTAHILKYKYKIDNSELYKDENIKGLVNQISCDDLFLAFLENTVNNDAELEKILTKVRQILLFEYSRYNNLGDGERRLIAALAHQCFNNEYVFEVCDEEDAQVYKLKKSIQHRITTIQSPSKELEIELLVYGMYASIQTLSSRERLADIPLKEWSDDIRPFLAKSLLHPMEEEMIMGSIGSIGAIRDRTSQLVQSQYEENPYPRWLGLPKSENTNIRHILNQEFPNFTQPNFLNGPIQMLVAGCGTGRHPIYNALHLTKNHDVEILAVDISKRSIAYAMRMARKYDVKNIRFLQGDILELHHIGKRFHIIECQGVLHHMERPIEGWRSLSNLLEKDGLMSIGLYSKAGRAGLVPLQEIFKSEGLTPGDNNVRKFRGRILKGEFGNVRLSTPDFYSTSGCRDLLFHFMEHQYTTQLLDSTMKELNLRFLGFTFEDLKTKALYRKHFPQDEEMTDLSLWGKFENLYPDTFAKMYHFWCQKQ